MCSALRPRASSSLPQVYELPFLVALDHRKEAVVVAVRGTMSLQVRGPTWVAGDRGPQPASCRCLPAEPSLPELTERSHEVLRKSGKPRTEEEEANPGL